MAKVLDAKEVRNRYCKIRRDIQTALLHQKEELVNLRAGASRRPPGQEPEIEHKCKAIDATENYEFD